MRDMNDYELLQNYVTNGSEEAFATLSARYVNLVYSVAFRRVGDSHQAEEISQAVFIIMAKKAHIFDKNTILPGWLHRTVWFVADNFKKADLRRRNREQEAFRQSLLQETESDTWSHIAPVLDSAVADLSSKDRDAIILRFFEGKSLNAVGKAIGASEDAARKRVDRAIDKLRASFIRRGIVISSSVLVAALSTHAIQAAPTSCILTATGSTASSWTLMAVADTLKHMLWAKIKTAALIGVTIALTVTVSIVGIIKNRTARMETAFSQLNTLSLENAPINSTSTEASISQTVDGTFYFTSDRPGGFGNYDIYRARFTNQSWQAENLGSAINTSGIDVDPFVAPDERFVIVTKVINGTANMCVYFNNRKGGWTAPVSLVSLCSYGWGPDISTDGRYFFFMSPDGTQCRWVSVAAIDNLNPLPTIKTNPVSQTALPGNNITFNVAAGGTAPLRYQWWFNQTNSLPSATNSTLTLTNVQLTNAGSYFVVVTNTLGSITSNPALLMADPAFVKLGTASPGTLSFRSWIGVPFALECSSNLLQWSALTTLTNLTGALDYTDSESADYPCRFYRARIP